MTPFTEQLPAATRHFDNTNPLPGIDLSLRELDIIRCMSLDQNVKMIASALELSVFTIQDHIKHIKTKMGVHTSGGMVAKAFRSGLIN